MNEKIRQLKEIIDGTDNLVFFGGAGESLLAAGKVKPDYLGIFHIHHLAL